MWVWWLLGVLVVALLVGVPLLVRARRRSAWRQSLAEGEADVAWFARELVPELRRTGSVERVAGGWAVSSHRVVALEDQLTSLEATAFDDSARRRALELRDAVRSARARLDSVSSAQALPHVALELDEVAATLEAVLSRPAPTNA